MRYIKLPKGLLEKTKALVRLSLFLNEVGLKENLSARKLKQLFTILKSKKG